MSGASLPASGGPVDLGQDDVGADGRTRTLLDAGDIARAVDRLAHQIVESLAKTPRDAVLLGIPTRGVPLAHRLAARVGDFDGPRIPVGSLDITMYRDDLRMRGVRPLGETLDPDGGVTGRTAILVDDVLFSGRTVRAALDAIAELGRPASVQLAVLVDRGHRQLPIKADYVGKNVPTAASESVHVRFVETDGLDSVAVVTDAGPAERHRGDGNTSR